MADPTVLFSPPKNSSPHLKSDAPGPSDSDSELSLAKAPLPLRTRLTSRFASSAVYVSVPILSEKTKASYKPFSEEPIPSDDEFSGMKLHSIIGEYKQGSKLFYFVKLQPEAGAGAFKIPAKRIQAKYAKLVGQYEERKAMGLVNLAEFDPGASYIHPSSRVHLKLSLPATKKQSSTMLSNKPDSDDFHEAESSAGELEDGSYSSPAPNTRRTTRQTAASSSLPFSPRKTRSKVFAESEESEDIPLVEDRVRRSTRAKKNLRSNLDDDDYVDERSGSRGRSPSHKKKKARNPKSRPAYGHIRGIADLDYDSDEDTRALRSHRGTCEKCHRLPTNKLLASSKGKRKKTKKNDEADDDDSTEKLAALGGWVQCLKCPVSAHWGCLARTQRGEILRAILERERTEWRLKNAGSPSLDNAPAEVNNPITEPEPTRKLDLDPDSITQFVCGSCTKGGYCMGCQEVALEPDGGTLSTNTTSLIPAQTPPVQFPVSGDVDMVDGATDGKQVSESALLPKELLFRCFTCKRIAHYSHLPLPDPNEESDAVSLAEYYQFTTHWQCADCYSFVYLVDSIIAWRPSPAHAVEPPRVGNEPPNYKLPLPREYLVKWQDRSFRRLQWVPHMWLVATNPTKLKNFLAGSRPVELLPEPVGEDSPDALMAVDPVGVLETPGDDTVGDPNKTATPEGVSASTSGDPIPDAECRIQPAWKTVDRVLDVLLWRPQKRYHTSEKKGKGKGKQNSKRVLSDDDELEGEDEENAEREFEAAFANGEEPSSDLVETVKQFENRTRRKLAPEDADLVVWVFIKWHDLGYDAATWDTPPRQTEKVYSFFKQAFTRFVRSRSVTVPIRTTGDLQLMNARHTVKPPIELQFTVDDQPKLGQADGFKLMPFQVAGVNWLCSNWWKLQHCILADEMGLGKTVQIVTFLGVVVKLGAFPALVVVPNSTITNWVREFERWAPHLRVCSFYGDAKSRDIIKQYELWHTETKPKTTGAKFHVLVTTFETVTNVKEFGPVFKQTPRWEVLVVDEGQRLKSDSSLIFKRLGELNTAQRIILTGTPLNNNIRELFNLMNFLDPGEWKNLERLTKEFEVLTEERVRELHVKLRPYFLRRVKAEVLQLPPKNEVIVPVSMAPLQKEIYRSIFSQNATLLQTLSQGAVATKLNPSVKNAKTNMNNILMQLRKCLQHPYLVSRDIEPAGLSPIDAHEKLIDASAKLQLMRVLLPKLKARGHRVLLFSQFSIGLTILEDFLIGEKHKYLRLDGNTKQADRQKGMDEFNKPNSDVFIYLLTTRAGGVGINLWSADTVIIFDPDFNPHQDLQAIARAHRFGQKKTCLVFKLMVKDSAEERIMQTGKKKLVLDHLIVQKMEDDDAKEDVQSILMFGAQTLFQDGENQASRDIHYSAQDVDSLIEKTEKEGDQQEEQGKDGSLFSFAKVWASDRDGLVEMTDETDNTVQADSWAQTLERLANEMAKQQEAEATGRGVRRRAAAVFPGQQIIPGIDTPKKDKKKKQGKGKGKEKAAGEDSDAYVAASALGSEDESVSNPSAVDEDFPAPAQPKPKRHTDTTGPIPLSPIHTSDLPRSPAKKSKSHLCGLCGNIHSESGTCFMTESAENLAEFRSILLSHEGDETIEERRAAIAIIDKTLYKRNKLHLIYGQPLSLVDPPGFRQEPTPNQPLPTHQPSASNDTSFQIPVASTSTIPPRPKPHPINGSAGPSKMHLPPGEDATSSPFGHSLVKSKHSKSKHHAVTTPASKPSPIGSAAKSGRVVSTAGTSTDGVPSQPKPVSRAFPDAVTNSLKRPSPPTQSASLSKKQKQTKDLPCPICKGPLHPAKDCPLVRRGSQSILQEIKRLKTDPVNEPTVQILRALFKKHQTREQLAVSGSGAVPDPIEGQFR